VRYFAVLGVDMSVAHSLVEGDALLQKAKMLRVCRLDHGFDPSSHDHQSPRVQNEMSRRSFCESIQLRPR
jgi:hypothetical protein